MSRIRVWRIRGEKIQDGGEERVNCWWSGAPRRHDEQSLETPIEDDVCIIKERQSGPFGHAGIRISTRGLVHQISIISISRIVVATDEGFFLKHSALRQVS